MTMHRRGEFNIWSPAKAPSDRKAPVRLHLPLEFIHQVLVDINAQRSASGCTTLL
jgi:hypothetical protein